MSKETMFDDMKNWSNENSREGLDVAITSARAGRPIEIDYRYESVINQMLAFMVRDLEKAKGGI